MKRFLALAAALCVLFSSAFAQEAQVETTAVQAGTASGVTIWCNHQETISDLQRSALDYPTFECSDKDFEQFLTENITQPILDMAVVDEGIMRGGFKASLDFDGILSLEASIHRLEDDAQETEVELFCALVDLNGKRMLELSELFTEPEAVVEEAICAAVYRQAEELELLVPEIDNGGLVPMPDTFFVTGDALQVLYDTHTLSVQAVSLKLPWEELPLSWSPVLTGETSISEPKAEPVIVTLEPSSTVMATVAPFPAEPVIVTMEPSSTVMATVSPFPAETLNPYFSLAPVSTPTPMPVAGNDAIMVDVLTHGLWKPLGTEGDVYYQFTADGKLLTIQVDEYSVRDGVLTSDILNGTLDIGSDSAFVLRDGNELSGYVLNRQGERVAPEEFVTPSPTPVPTPTPTPSPEPTPTPTPTPEPTPTPTPVPTATPTPTPTPVPTPTPTPTPSPWEIALATAPRMGTVEASFEKARTLKVYSAPDEEAWAAERAQVTTDHTVAIYGRESGWVLVSYAIGDGSRGRTGYIDDMTLADPSSVPLLDFCHMPLTLVRNAKATDDPLRSQSTITTLQKGSEVTLLAFFGDDWAYVETTHEEKICRLFIPASALKED